MFIHLRDIQSVLFVKNFISRKYFHFLFVIFYIEGINFYELLRIHVQNFHDSLLPICDHCQRE